MAEFSLHASEPGDGDHGAGCEMRKLLVVIELFETLL